MSLVLLLQHVVAARQSQACSVAYSGGSTFWWRGGGVWVMVSVCQRHSLLGGAGHGPPLGNVWNIDAFSSILGHLLTNFRDSEKEVFAHTSVFHWTTALHFAGGMAGGIPSRKIDRFTCSLLDSRAFSGLNSNKFRSFLRNQLLLFPTFTNIMTNNGKKNSATRNRSWRCASL